MSPLHVLLDTNVVISAILFGGKPGQILQLAIDRKIQLISSPALLGELLDVLAKKFLFPKNNLLLVERKIKKICLFVYPPKSITILRDNPDNRVLEAAKAGKCECIVTGDRDLLNLKRFRTITIQTPEQFLKA